MQVELYDLSKYRGELMGFSALMIFVCHAYAYIELPSVLGYALSIGNIGVDCFLFLSGLGMWYSLSKSQTGGVKCWYLNRYKKLFVPYLITALSMDAIKYYLGEYIGEGIWNYLFGLSTLRFYVSHDAAWFIAALIPLYLLAPGFYSLIKKYKWKAAMGLIIVQYFTLLIPATFSNNLLNSIIENIQFVVVRTNCFIVGMAIGNSVMCKKKLSVEWLMVMMLIGILAIVVTRHIVYGLFFFTIPLLISLCYLLRIFPKVMYKFVSLMGKISLESYILNGTLPKLAIVFFTTLNLPKMGNIIPYVTACIVSIPIGYYIHLLSNKILKAI